MPDEKHRKPYDDQFKREAVQFYAQHDMSLAEAGRHFGVVGQMLYKWVKEFPSDATPAHSIEEEVRLLRQEMKALKEDLGALKKIVSKSLVKRALL